MSDLPVISRRSFLKLAAAAAAARIIVPAWTPPRLPYVHVGQDVDYIGRCATDRCFIGSTLVHAVGEWDRIGYPVTLRAQTYRPGDLMPYRFYDFDLCTLRDEVPGRFWADEENWRRYPNVHTYVRTRRFGESVAEAIRSLNMAHTEEWVKAYG